MRYMYDFTINLYNSMIEYFEGDPNGLSPYSSSGMTRLEYATICGDIKTVKKLLTRGANVNSISDGNSTVLWCASISNNLNDEIFKILLEYNANPILSHISLFSFIAWSSINLEKKCELVKLLLDNGADPNITQNEILEIDTEYPFGEQEKKYIEDEVPPIFKAANSGEFRILKLFLSYNADINFKSEKGYSVFDSIRIVRKIGEYDYEIDQIKTAELKARLKPYFEGSRVIDHIARREGIDDADRKILKDISDSGNKELFEVMTSRFTSALLNRVGDNSPEAIIRKYKSQMNLSKSIEQVREFFIGEEEAVRFLDKIKTEKGSEIEEEVLMCVNVIEEIAQVESLMLTAKHYREKGDKEHKILTYDGLIAAIKFISESSVNGADEFSAEEGKDHESEEIKAYKEMLSIYESNPEYKDVGYVFAKTTTNIEEFRLIYKMLTKAEKTCLIMHLNNILDRVPNIISHKARVKVKNFGIELEKIDEDEETVIKLESEEKESKDKQTDESEKKKIELKETLSKDSGLAEVSNTTIVKFTEQHETTALSDYTDDYNLPVDNLHLAGSSAGVGLAADIHET